MMTPTDLSATHNPQVLSFEHLGVFSVTDTLVAADPRYVESRFAGLRTGFLPVCSTLPAEPGMWQAFAVRSDDDQSVSFLLTCHSDELENRSPFDDVEALGVLTIDTGQVTIVDAEQRDHPALQSAAEATDRKVGPRMIHTYGVIAELPKTGIFPLYASRGARKRVVFVAFTHD
ncbi:MAG: hypothetical protein V3V08_03635 [Nannocystaceae bacterium]